MRVGLFKNRRRRLWILSMFSPELPGVFGNPGHFSEMSWNGFGEACHADGALFRSSEDRIFSFSIIHISLLRRTKCGMHSWHVRATTTITTERSPAPLPAGPWETAPVASIAPPDSCKTGSSHAFRFVESWAAVLPPAPDAISCSWTSPHTSGTMPGAAHMRSRSFGRWRSLDAMPGQVGRVLSWVPGTMLCSFDTFFPGHLLQCQVSAIQLVGKMSDCFICNLRFFGRSFGPFWEVFWVF